MSNAEQHPRTDESPTTAVDHKQDTPINQLLPSDSSPPLTAFQQDLLYTVAKATNDEEVPGAPHGLKIKDLLEERYTNEVHHGRLYPNLDSLVEYGLLEKSTIDRRTNGYQLSELGMEWMYQDVQTRNEIADEVFN